MNNGNWRFPGNGGTKKNGLDTTDFHTFMDDAVASLAREICQNSNDAKDPDIKKPACVEFHSFDMKTSNIPHLEELLEELDRCLDYWEKDGNEGIVERLKKMKLLLKAERIDVLRISDFNTTGLPGVNDYDNESTPWYSLMHGSGESGKSGSEGGSKGVGKYATFVNSAVRTVFYSTNAKSGETGYQGIAYFCSSKVKDSPDGELTQGIGYFGTNKKNDPVDGQVVFDHKFTRKANEYGTDIYILGFDTKGGWKKDIVTKILDSFMVAIMRGRLQITVDDVEINAGTVKDIVFNDLLVGGPARKSVVSQFVLLSGGESVIYKSLSVEYDGDEVGKVELYFKKFDGDEQQFATNNCAMVRYPLMKIQDIKTVSSVMACSALCVIPDGQLMKYLKMSENPEHNQWVPNRIENKDQRKIMKVLLDDLSNKIKTTILDALRSADADETDATGASKYLPEYEKGKEKPSKTGTEKPKPIVSKPTKKKTSEIDTYYEDPNGNGIGLDIVDEDPNGEEDGLFPEGENESDGGPVKPGKESKKGKKGGGGGEAFIRQHMKGITYHWFCLNKKKGEYGLSFVSPKDVQKVECFVYMVDESGAKTPVGVLSAKRDDKPLEVKDGRKILFSMSEGERVTLRLETDQKRLFSAEVTLYAAR